MFIRHEKINYISQVRNKSNDPNEYNPEVFQNTKIVCLREIRIFTGSGRSQIWINRLQIAQNGHFRINNN